MALLFLLGDYLVDALGDPRTLSGRIELWALVWAYVSEHLWLGAGYGAFWQSGAASPVLQLGRGWVIDAAHSHNGYLELWVTCGLIGLGLAALSAVVLPLLRLFRTRVWKRDLALAWLSFLLLQNGTETRLYQGSREEWALHLIMLALLVYNKKTRALQVER